LTLRFTRLCPAARAPTRAHETDAALDLYAAERAELQPGGRASVGTGIAVALEEGHAGLVLPRSGLAARHGVTLANAPGLVDPEYRGELRVLLFNADPVEPYRVAAGDRIAQLMLVRFDAAVLEEVDSLEATVRGVGGFGSSGR
jgi:dUTP pyrophosphatase